MQYYPINLVRQKLYANETVLITFHLITFHSIAFSKKKREEVKILRELQLGPVWSA